MNNSGWWPRMQIGHWTTGKWKAKIGDPLCLAFMNGEFDVLVLYYYMGKSVPGCSPKMPHHFY